MTTYERSTIVGVFENRVQAEAAIRDLQSAGFRDDQIGFVVRNDQAREEAPETVEHGTEAASGAAAGAVASLLIPGFGPAIAGGILAATVGGVVIGAATGGLFGALIGLGVPEEEARYYEGEFQSGRTLVTVKADGRQQEAYNILHRNGGYDVNTPAASRQHAPVTGPSTGQPAPVNDSGYGMQRDPSVETDATAKTYDTNVRTETTMERESDDTFFGNPDEPGVVPGSPNDPNIRHPRVP